MAVLTPLPSLLPLTVTCTLVLITIAVPVPPTPNGPIFGSQPSPEQPQPEVPTSFPPLEPASDPARLQRYKQMGLEPTDVPKSQPYENVHPDAKALPAIPSTTQNSMMIGEEGITHGAEAVGMSGSAAGAHMMGSGGGGGAGNGGRDVGAVGRGEVAGSGMSGRSGMEGVGASHTGAMGMGGGGMGMGGGGIGMRGGEGEMRGASGVMGAVSS